MTTQSSVRAEHETPATQGGKRVALRSHSTTEPRPVNRSRNRGLIHVADLVAAAFLELEAADEQARAADGQGAGQ